MAEVNNNIKVFSWYGLGPLVRINRQINSERYIEELLNYHLISFLKEFEEKNVKYFFQQDNILIYISRQTRTFIKENEIILLLQSEQSSDLNPIKHLWNELERNM